MPVKMNTLHHWWAKFRGLQTYSDFAPLVSECNKGKEGCYGEWFYAPAERLGGEVAVIYSGSWDEGRPRDDPASTHAELFDMTDPEDAAEYTHRLRHWQAQPECEDQPG